MTIMLGLARPVRSRRIAETIAIGAPLVVALVAVGWRLGGEVGAIAAAAVGIGALAATAWRAGRVEDRWLARRLDAAGATEDSAELLFAPDAGLTGLARLQRDRLERRIAAALPDLRPAWRWRWIAAAWVAAAIVVAVSLVPPRPAAVVAVAAADANVSAAPGVPRLIEQRVRVVPPPYTGLPARDAATLDVRTPAGSHLRWALRFAPQPVAVDLAFADGHHLALRASGDLWTADLDLYRSTLYRVVPRGGATPPLHRLDATADAPPEVRVVTPDHSLSRVTPGQRRWPLVFAAHDDYGVAATARLHLTIAEGEGESVKFRETVVVVRGVSSATAKRFGIAPELAGLKFVAGSDLVAALEVSDNRAPGAQTARSPSVILRWPGAEGDAIGMEGVVTRALPAYFTSERQIIINAEALIKDQPRLTTERFTERSDGIGADQRLLRLRYGKFLGEEQEGGSPPPPTADAAPAAPIAEGDGKPTPPRFGGEAATLQDYGHVHDESEAATLVDPDTKTKLRGALDAMWQAELHLRQGAPRAALPFAYRALGLIKQVQQATRIFRARVGPNLPVVDETRRLTGKRDGLARSALPPVAATPGDVTPAAVWRALGDPGGATAAQLAALDRWARVNPTRIDPLAVTAAIDAVARDSGCGTCRSALRGLLWPALPRPAAGALPRPAASLSGRRYLDALDGAR